MRRIFLNSFFSFSKFQLISGTQALLSIFSIGFSYAILLNALGEEALGYIAFISAYFSIAKSFDPAITTGISRFISKSYGQSSFETNSSKEKNNKEIAIILDSATFASTCTSLILFTVTFFIIDFSFHGDMREQYSLSSLVSLTAIYFWLLSVSTLTYDVFDGYNRADIRSVLNIISYVVLIALVFILLPRFGLLGFLYAQICQQFFLIFASRIILNRTFSEIKLLPFHKHISFKKVQELVHFGFKIQFGSLLSNGGEPLMKLFLGMKGNFELLGLLEICLKIIVQIRAVIVGLFSPLMPKIALFFHREQYIKLNSLLRRNYFNLVILIIFFIITGLLGIFAATFFLYSELNFLIFEIGFMLLIGYSINSMGILAFQIGIAKGTFFWNYLSQFTIAFFCIIGAFTSSILNNDILIILFFSIGLLFSGLVSFFGNNRLLNAT